MTEIIYRANGTTLQNTSRALGKAGIFQTSYNQDLRPEDRRAVLESIPRQQLEEVMNGDLRVIPRETRTFSSGRDTITGIDFDVVQNQRNTIEDSDPIYIIRGPTAEKTAEIVREILEEQVSIDVLTNGFANGIDSIEFETSINDLAGLQGKDPRKVRQECIDLLIASSVNAMRNPTSYKKRVPTKQQKSVTQIVQPITGVY